MKNIVVSRKECLQAIVEFTAIFSGMALCGVMVLVGLWGIINR